MLGAISALLGAIFDGAASSYFSRFTACASQSTLTYYGDISDYSMLANCVQFRPEEASNTCICVTSSANSCSRLVLQHQYSDCGQILQPFAAAFKASAGLCATSIFLALCLSLAIFALNIYALKSDVDGRSAHNDELVSIGDQGFDVNENTHSL
jgi:hypothetical protein